MQPGSSMDQSPSGDDDALSLLEEVEVLFRRMISGIFRFIFVRLPTWIYEICKDFFDWLGRAIRYLAKFSVRLIRALFFVAIWGTLVFGPLAVGMRFSSPNAPKWTLLKTWTVVGVCWAAVGLMGSIWGLNRWWEQRKERLAAQGLPSSRHKSIWRTDVTATGCFTVLLLVGLVGVVVLLLRLALSG